MSFLNIGIIELMFITIVGGILCFPTISFIIVLLAKLLGIRMRAKIDRE